MFKLGSEYTARQQQKKSFSYLLLRIIKKNLVCVCVCVCGGGGGGILQ